MDKKQCSKCLEVKKLNEFYTTKGRNIYGRCAHCKRCMNEYFKKWRKENKEYDTERKRKYRQENREHVNKIKRQYYYDNKEKHQEWQKKVIKKRYRSDSTFRLNNSMSSMIHQVLKGDLKRRFWEDLVGYTLSELIWHLETLFKYGMTWDNYGEWHVDHIVPKSIFRYKTSEDPEFKICWSLDNLQPLWAEENFRKNNKIIF